MHRQVPFRTIDGKDVEVDEGLLGVLECLKKLGVHAQFSCQGEWGQNAYITADRKSFKRFERMMKTAISMRYLTTSSWLIISKFIRAGTLVELSFYTGGGTFQWFRLILKSRRWNRSTLTRELTYDNEWGARQTYRWDFRYTPMFQKALKEILVEKGSQNLQPL